MAMSTPWSDAILYVCRKRGLCAFAFLALLLLQGLAFRVADTNRELTLGAVSESISNVFLPNLVEVNKGLAALGVFVFVETLLFACAFFHLRDGEQRENVRKIGRSLVAVAGLYILGFLAMESWFQSLKFSAFWASDCSEYQAAERLRLSDFTRDLEYAQDVLLPARNLSDARCKLYIAINAVPNRTNRYLSQTIGSLLRSFSQEEIPTICRIEILSDVSSEELQSMEQYRLKPLVETVYNPANRQTPFVKSMESWKEGSILHYLHAMERCAGRQAEYCLVLDDDTLASRGWLSEALQNIRDLEGGRFGSEGEHWTILKLFQPVWGNLRQSWQFHNSYLLLLLALFGALPCGLLAICSKCSVLTPSVWFWSSAGFVAALYVFWAIGKANLEWIVGDAAVHPYGTCHMAQANLLHRERAEAAGFLQHLQSHVSGPFIDLSICEFFNEHPHLGPMWATSPSLFQHGGLLTSLPNKLGQRPCRIRIFHEGVWRHETRRQQEPWEGQVTLATFLLYVSSETDVALRPTNNETRPPT